MSLPNVFTSAVAGLAMLASSAANANTVEDAKEASIDNNGKCVPVVLYDEATHNSVDVGFVKEMSGDRTRFLLAANNDGSIKGSYAVACGEHVETYSSNEDGLYAAVSKAERVAAVGNDRRAGQQTAGLYSSLDR